LKANKNKSTVNSKHFTRKIASSRIKQLVISKRLRRSRRSQPGSLTALRLETMRQSVSLLRSIKPRRTRSLKKKIKRSKVTTSPSWRKLSKS